MRFLTLGLYISSMLSVAEHCTAQKLTFHDEESAKLAVSARDGFSSTTTDKSNVFQVMTANTLALQVATIAELRALNRSHVTAATQLVPTMTWTQLVSSTADEQAKVVGVYSQSLKITGQPGTRTIATANEALDDAQSRLSTLKKEQAKAEKDYATKDIELDIMKKSIADLRISIDKSTKPVHSLADLQEFTNLQDSWKDIQDVQEWLKQAFALHGSPGLQLTILDLAVQHQAKEVERAQLALDHAKSLSAHATEMQEIVSDLLGDGTTVNGTNHVSSGVFGKLYNYMEPCSVTSGATCPTEPFLGPSAGAQSNCPVSLGRSTEQTIVTIGKLSLAARAEVGTCTSNSRALRNLTNILALYAAMVGYKQFLLLQNALDITAEEQLYSINLSRINAADREVLLSHGLSGLAEYYAGGITAQDISNVFQAANTIATGVIAGRIP